MFGNTLNIYCMDRRIRLEFALVFQGNLRKSHKGMKYYLIGVRDVIKIPHRVCACTMQDG